MSTAMQVYDGGDFELMQRAAMAMSASGFFSDAKSEAQAIVKVMAGAELGIAPFAAMTGIHIIKGKPQIGAVLLAGVIENDPRYDYRVEKMEDDEVIIAFYKNGKKSGVSSFSARDAKRAGTQNMGKFPRNMLFARAMSNGYKWYCAGAGGGMPVYTEGELGGNVIEGEIDYETGEIIPPPQLENDPPADEWFNGNNEPPFVPDEPEPPAALETEERTAVEIATALIEAAGSGSNPPTAPMLSKVQKDLSKVCMGNKNAKMFIKSVFNADSSKDLSYGQVKALLDWIGSNKENGWVVSPTATAEAAVVLKNE